MKLVSLTICRNEDWVIGASLRAALRWCDESVILLHSCTDRTRQIVEHIRSEHPGRVLILTATDSMWTEMEHRQWTLDEARAKGATHCAVVDADEILCGDMLPTIRAKVAESMPGWFAGIKMHNLIDSLDHYRSEPGVWGQRAGTMLAFTDRPDLSWRVPRGEDYHHRSPVNSRRMGWIDGSGIMHLQFASRRRLLAKHAWYKMIERLRFPQKDRLEINRLYNMAPDTDGIVAASVPDSWWEPYRDLLQYINLDAEPWQERACRDMWAQHGAAMFAGLNLFGIVEEVAA